MAGLNRAIDARLLDANGEDLPAAVPHQRLGPRSLSESDRQKRDRRRLARPERSAKNTARRLWRTVRLGATARRRAKLS